MSLRTAAALPGGIPRAKPGAGRSLLVHGGPIDPGPCIGPARELLGAVGFTRSDAEVLIRAEPAWPGLLVGDRSGTGGDKTQQDRAIHVRTSSKAHAWNWASREPHRTRALRAAARGRMQCGIAARERSVVLGAIGRQPRSCPARDSHLSERMVTVGPAPARSRIRFSTWAPFPIAILVAVAAAMGIANPAIYARETASWAAQGTGQDWINLVVCVPAMLAVGTVAVRGSRIARVIVGGLLLYTAYSFVIYAFAMHFTTLFLVDCTALGASTFAVVDLVIALRAEAVESWYDGRAPIRITAATLLGIAVIFGMLWLIEIVPALATGTDPTGLAEVGLATNPVHVLDLSLLLPAMIVVGVALVRRRSFGEVLAPILLTFAIMMAIAIGGMVGMMYRRGLALDATPTIAMAVVAAWCLGTLIALLRHLRRRQQRNESGGDPAIRDAKAVPANNEVLVPATASLRR